LKKTLQTLNNLLKGLTPKQKTALSKAAGMINAIKNVNVKKASAVTALTNNIRKALKIPVPVKLVTKNVFETFFE